MPPIISFTLVAVCLNAPYTNIISIMKSLQQFSFSFSKYNGKVVIFSFCCHYWTNSMTVTKSVNQWRLSEEAPCSILAKEHHGALLNDFDYTVGKIYFQF